MFKKRIFIHVLVIFMAFSFTSCISIIEKVFFAKNGSGTYTLTVDMSKVANMMAMLGEDNEELNSSMGELTSGFDKAKAKIEAIDGIYNVRNDINKENLIITISFDFENAEALNRGISQYTHGDKPGPVEQYVFYTQKKKTITRSSVDLISEALGSALEEQGGADMDLSAILSDMYLENVIEFERNIKSYSNLEYSKEDPKTITWRKYLFNKNDEDKSIGVTVKTK